MHEITLLRSSEYLIVVWENIATQLGNASKISIANSKYFIYEANSAWVVAVNGGLKAHISLQETAIFAATKHLNIV